MLPFLEFCRRFNILLYDWQREAFGGATARVYDRFRYPIAGVSVPRGNGKTDGAADVGLWKLMSGRPGTDVLGVALDTDGAGVMLEHARAKIRHHPVLDREIEIRSSGLFRSNGSRWTIASREHTNTRGRHPDVVIYDECGWARDDELFSSLLAGQASVTDPLMLVVSTVGRRKSGPLWTVKQLAEGGDASVYWFWTGENLSPRVTGDFLARQRRVLLPAQFAREHQNTWGEAADAFTSSADIDAAMTGREQRFGEDGREYVAFVDLGTVRDPSVICVGHREADIVVIDLLLTFQGTREFPVQIKTVEDAIRDLATKFRLRTIRIESWQGIAAAQSLQRLGLPVVLFTPTAKAHAEEWPLLAQALTARRLRLYPHARLREELLNLVYEVGPQGVRVIDRGAVHQDHAVAVRGVVAQLFTAASAQTEDDRLKCLSAGGKGDAPRAVADDDDEPESDPLFDAPFDKYLGDFERF
jgi:hypothetical protein